MTEPVQPEATYDQWMPTLSIESAIARRNLVLEFTRRVMEKGKDYGIVPGTEKFTLLKPGAEKLANLFGLTPTFEILETERDWTGQDHAGEPFFYYLYKCKLWRGESLVAEGDGSCNSFEKKYRYRRAERVCPLCAQAAIIKGRQEWGGGWVCLAKKGGCGAKYRDGDPAIEGQEVGLVPNPDIADVVNTIQKMAQKRALVGAVLLAVNASEFFTQDLEDLPYLPGLGAAPQTLAAPALPRPSNGTTQSDTLAPKSHLATQLRPQPITPTQRQRLAALYITVYGAQDKAEALDWAAADFEKHYRRPFRDCTFDIAESWILDLTQPAETPS